ncbi:hypothetical protein BOX15_Mlig020434g1 [Macrostomum lignano]|uniref:UBIQUITIN_CONJUGAT_2 domain-containing protein n=2 Tax=Macrostomum lignano TaxID=282301 RepID=A0A1I8I0K0_9PLAT|nr:hypothetical protein BOX15_Mlig020434g2 [Macrostomum lignano]PAA94225.1 hypothetical protein BOX15_Mlig020434g1 [Macrostomum lignano]
MAGRHPHSSAVRALQQELKSLNDEPVEGFKVKLKDEDNIFEWDVAIFGPPGTLYQGGYFKASMVFPMDYPYSPPSISFISKMFHPNIYDDGKVCISILHPPGDDPASGELPSERWNPTQNVRTILLSVISLLNEPNTSSPANVDASVMFRKWKENKSDDYVKIVAKQVESTRRDAEADGVVVPTRVEDYVVRQTSGVDIEDQHNAYDYHYDDYDDYGDDCDTDDSEDADAPAADVTQQPPPPTRQNGASAASNRAS